MAPGAEEQGLGGLGDKPKPRRKLGRQRASKGRVVEAAPAWATALVEKIDQIGQRVAALEQKPEPEPGPMRIGSDAPLSAKLTLEQLAASGIPPEQWNQLVTPAVPPEEQTRTLPCELCEQIFTGVMRPHGTPWLCDECLKPGRAIRKCACGRVTMVERGTTEVVCRKCAKCCLCGDRTSDTVCARCIENGANVCTACTRLAKKGSSLCQQCDAAYKGDLTITKGADGKIVYTGKVGNAGQGKVVVPEPHPRALAEHADAVAAAIMAGDTEAAARLSALPDLQPAAR